MVIGLFSVSMNFVYASEGNGIVTVDLSILGTFLRAEPFDGRPTGGSEVEDPIIIDLEAHGLKEGDTLTTSYSGQVYFSAFWNDGDLGAVRALENIELIGIFSTSKDLNSIDNLNRVPGAIDYGKDFITSPTVFQKLETDIPEDFKMESSSGATVQIPKNAKYLFLCIYDGFYPDNFGTLNVSIQKSEQTEFPVELMAIGIIALIGLLLIFILFKRKKKKDEKNKNLES